MSDLCFYMHLTENEHYMLESDLKIACDVLSLTLDYYRKLEPHVPMYREIKITGSNEGIDRLRRWLARAWYSVDDVTISQIQDRAAKLQIDHSQLGIEVFQ